MMDELIKFADIWNTTDMFSVLQVAEVEIIT